MEEDPETLVRRIYVELVNQGNMAVAEELLAPDFVEHIPIPAPGQPTRGPQALTWFITAFRTAFPDLHVTVEQMIGEDAFVAVRVTWFGTHRGEFLGLSPTGKRVQVMGIDICRVAHGQVQEHWGQLDVVTFLQQLDLMPLPIGTPV